MLNSPSLSQETGFLRPFAGTAGPDYSFTFQETLKLPPVFLPFTTTR